eukprot:403351824
MSLGPQDERTSMLKTIQSQKFNQPSQDISSSIAMMMRSNNLQSQNLIGGAGSNNFLSGQYRPQQMNATLQDNRSQFMFSRIGGAGQQPLTTGGQISGAPVGAAGIGLNTQMSQGLTSYQQVKFQEEIKTLKHIIDKLSNKLKEYQNMVHLPDSDFQNLFIPDPSLLQDYQYNADLSGILSSHLLSPLFLEYESTTRQLERDLKNRNQECARQSEEIAMLVKENEEISTRLELQQREYLKIVEETRDNADLLAMRTGSLKSTDNQGTGNQGMSINVDEVKELRSRVHLLTEENHVLFEQITLLRSHYDKYNEEVSVKITDADAKSQSFDFLQKEFQVVANDRDELLKAQLFLEQKLQETVHLLSVVEEERKNDQSEMQRMRDQLQIFQKEYAFYKDHSERLEVKTNQESDQLQQQLREFFERDKDWTLKCDQLERENHELQQFNRQLQVEMQQQKRDLKQIMAINDQFQLQAQQFKDREMQFNELSKEYREKLEELKFERERQKSEGKRLQEKYEIMLQSRQRENERALQELENKLTKAQDEGDEYRRKYERLEKQSWEYKRSLDDNSKKENKQIQQFEKVIEQLKNEIKERERDLSNFELKEGYEKQTLIRDVKELKDQLQQQSDKMSSIMKELENSQRDYQRLKDENIILKATVQETDKSRELVVREISNIKDVQEDRLKSVESKKDAELRMQEKLIEGLKRDKKDLEERIEEILSRHEIIQSKAAEDHHNTVSYFENLVAQHKIQLQKFTYPERDRVNI